MTKHFNLLLLGCCLFSLPVLFNSCVKDTCKEHYTYRLFSPVYKTVPEVIAQIKSSEPKPVEQAGKIYIWGNYIFLNDVDRGIHIIDNTNRSNPRNIAYIPIPGNMDLAVKGNTLYADFYEKLLSIDISDPLNVHVENIMEDVFPLRKYSYGFRPDLDLVITDWISKDSAVVSDCEIDPPSFLYDFAMPLSSSYSSSASASPFGAGGSMARFAIKNNRMYAVSQNSLDVLDISSPFNPQHTSSVSLNWGIETIYPFRDELFIGSQSGMFRYDITNPDLPVKTGQFGHVRSCDPVVADDTHAYVTLRSGTTCQGFTNQLDILDLSNPLPDQQFSLQKTYQMKNPHGLAKDGHLLFICDGEAGLKIYDASNILDLKLIRTFEMSAIDVIALGGHNLVVAKDGLYQFDYSNADDIHLLSRTVFN